MTKIKSSILYSRTISLPNILGELIITNRILTTIILKIIYPHKNNNNPTKNWSITTKSSPTPHAALSYKNNTKTHNYA